MKLSVLYKTFSLSREIKVYDLTENNNIYTVGTTQKTVKRDVWTIAGRVAFHKKKMVFNMVITLLHTLIKSMGEFSRESITISSIPIIR